MKEESMRVSDHTHHHHKDSEANHVHQSKEEAITMERKLSGKFSGIENMKK